MLKRAYIEITNECNLQCSFCPPTKREIQYMGEALFLNILNQLQGTTRYLYFHVKGEPLLHPNLIKYISLSHSLGFFVNITTNGTVIEANHNELLFAKGLRQVSFSLQSFENNPDKLHSYLIPIFNFAKEAIKRDILIELRLWNLHTSKTIENLFMPLTPIKSYEVTLQNMDIIEDKGISQNHDISQNKDTIQNKDIIQNKEILDYIQAAFELSDVIEEKILKEKGIKLKENLYLSQSTEFEWPSLKNPNYGTSGTCYGLRQQIAILVDGTVIPCCLDQEAVIKLGNVKTQPISEIMNSQRAINICEGFKQHKKVEVLCQHCGYSQRFT